MAFIQLPNFPSELDFIFLLAFFAILIGSAHGFGKMPFALFRCGKLFDLSKSDRFPVSVLESGVIDAEVRS